MNAQHDRLHADLSDLAEEVSVVDLRDRTLRTSRRMAVRRTLVGVASAVAVLVAGGGTALAVLPQRNAALPPAASVSGSPTPTASPSAAQSPSASATTSATGSPARQENQGVVLAGDVYVLTFAQNSAGKLLRRDSDGSWHTQLTLPELGGAGSASVSPDLTKTAWWNKSVEPNVLMVGDSHGRNAKAVATVNGSGCAAPVWTPDSKGVLFSWGTNAQTTQEMVGTDGSGRRTIHTYKDNFCDQSPVPSADGKTLVDSGYQPGTDNYTVFTQHSDGTGRRTVPVKLPANQTWPIVLAVSPDGSSALVATSPPDCGCDSALRYSLLNLTTGAMTELNGTNPGQHVTATFDSAGRVVLLDLDYNDNSKHRLTVYGADGSVLAHLTPPPMTDYGLQIMVH